MSIKSIDNRTGIGNVSTEYGGGFIEQDGQVVEIKKIMEIANDPGGGGAMTFHLIGDSFEEGDDKVFEALKKGLDIIVSAQTSSESEYDRTNVEAYYKLMSFEKVCGTDSIPFYSIYTARFSKNGRITKGSSELAPEGNGPVIENLETIWSYTNEERPIDEAIDEPTFKVKRYINFTAENQNIIRDITLEQCGERATIGEGEFIGTRNVLKSPIICDCDYVTLFPPTLEAGNSYRIQVTISTGEVYTFTGMAVRNGDANVYIGTDPAYLDEPGVPYPSWCIIGYDYCCPEYFYYWGAYSDIFKDAKVTIYRETSLETIKNSTWKLFDEITVDTSEGSVTSLTWGKNQTDDYLVNLGAKEALIVMSASVNKVVLALNSNKAEAINAGENANIIYARLISDCGTDVSNNSKAIESLYEVIYNFGRWSPPTILCGCGTSTYTYTHTNAINYIALTLAGTATTFPNGLIVSVFVR